MQSAYSRGHVVGASKANNKAAAKIAKKFGFELTLDRKPSKNLKRAIKKALGLLNSK